MAAKTITNSNNIASLDFACLSDLCEGIFSVDLSPSIWIASGYNNVHGASVKVTNPYGVVIKYPTTSGYDIYPPMTSSVGVDIPTQANNYQYGTYLVEVFLTDANGTIYTLSKPVKICAPNPKNKNVNYGSLSATLDGNCVTGRVAIMADTVPTYQGSISDSQVNDFTLKYPTVSEMAPETTIIGSFSAQLFEGEYRFEGTICAHYSLGDNIFANVNYRVKRYKTIRCLLDKSCVAARLAELQYQISQDCTDKEKIATQNTIINALLLLTVIDGLTNDGQDASDYIAQLENVLGCVCTCNCADGTPIIPINPTDDFVIEGCNVSLVTAGLTHTYTIENYAYVVAITDNGNAITITSPTLDDCTKTQTITFNIAVVYEQIKSLANGGSEHYFWASLTNHSLDSLDIDCLGVSQESWDDYSLQQRMQFIVNKSCASGDCDAALTLNTVTTSGSDVIVSWTKTGSPFEVYAYIDNVFAGSVLYSELSYTFIGASDGDYHTYYIFPKCTNGAVGGGISGSFTYYGCPTIAPVTVTSNNVPAATCPYNLSALVNSTPIGTYPEYHNLANTNASSLVPDATGVADGSYYIYAKDADGCYSLPVNVVIVCATASACSAPQNLLVENISYGFRVRFQSASYPPPANSYTVKRRITSDPDTAGSYTTIGTPTWDASSSTWQILDTTAVNNVSYTYRAISNCASTAPYVDYIFANIICPTVTLTPATTTMGYSFVGIGGSVSKYEVKIYDATGVTLIHTDTILPAFSNPITGTFIYLSAGTLYKVRVTAYIGSTYSTTCAFVSGTTISNNYTLLASYGQSISSVTGTGVPSPALPATGANGSAQAHHTAMSGSYSIAIVGPAVANISMRALVNGVQQSCVNIAAGTGTYSLSITAAEIDDVRITIVMGVC